MKSFIFIITILFHQLAFAEELNVFNWGEMFNPKLVNKFAKQNNIRVNYDLFDSDFILESKLVLGINKYDVVSPTIFHYVERYVGDGIYQPLDLKKIPNIKYIDPRIKKLLADHKLTNYAVPWIWSILAVGYNQELLQKHNPQFDPSLLSHILDPKMLATISGCGVAFLDSPSEIIAFILNYLGKNTSSYNIQDYILAINVLRNISPHIASFSSAKYTANWVNGDACLVVGYSGDLITYKRKAENKNLKFTIPKEGSILILDGLTILNDASNKNAAHNFINYMIDPEIAKENLLYNKTFSALDAKYLGDRQPVEIKLINDDYFKKLRVMHKRPQHIENMINFEWQKLMSLR